MRQAVAALASASVGLGLALATTFVAPASEAAPRSSALVTRESLRQTLSFHERGPAAGVTIRETRRLHARLNVPLPGLDPAAVSGDTYLGLRIGDWTFQRPLSSDRTWKPGRTRASFRVPSSDPNRRGATVVQARWDAGVLRVFVVSASESPIAATMAAAAAGPLSSSLDGAARLGAAHVHLGGAATGAMTRTEVPVLDASVSLARVELAGHADVAAETADVQPPAVTITRLGSVSTVAVGWLVEGTVSDDRSIASLTWSIDGGAESNVPFHVDPASGFLDDLRGTFSFSVPATGGTHSLRVLARDAAGNTSSATIGFTVPFTAAVTLRAVRWGVECVDAEGRVQAWGYGTTSPTVAPGIAGARAAAGNLALLDDGTVTTLHGDPTGASSSSAPFPIDGLSDVTDVAQCSATAPNASYARRADGTVWAWGDNSHGQLGDGTMASSRYPPIQVPGLPAIRAISAGADHALALDKDGGVWAWGGLAALTDPAARSPRKISGIANAVVISASQFDRFATGAAVLADGSLWMWGDATSGQLGGSAVARNAPAFMVPGVTGAQSVALGYNHVLVLLYDATVLARGGPTSEVTGYWGELGNGTTIPDLEFQSVPGLSGVAQISAGAHTSLALLQDGTIRGWGQNTFGSVGDGTTIDALSPVEVLLEQ